jgi:hypothetical protein
MKKLVSLLLALLLICALLPMSAMAAEEKVYTKNEADGKWYEWADEKLGAVVTDKDLIASLDKSLSEYLASLNKAGPIVHTPQEHSFGYASNTKYHWLQCACGCKISMEPHIDPKKALNDLCTCGYKFSDNADLTVLWVEGAFPIKNFKKDVTEYEVKAHTYKDFKEVKFSTFTHDSEATVEYPKDLTLKDGKNVFEIKVTSENQKVTKVYTVTVVK